MKKLMVAILVSTLVGCSNGQQPSPVETGSAPVVSETTMTMADLEQSVLEEAKTWVSADQAWERVHPDNKAALSEENTDRAKRTLNLLMEVGKERQWTISEYTATPSASYTFPVQPTHMVRSQKGVPVFRVRLDPPNWYVVVAVPSKAAEEFSGERKMPDEEKKAIADKVRSELSPEQRELLTKILKTDGKLAAIKELRKTDAHPLNIQKLVIEGL